MTVAALRNSSLHMTSLFPDSVISKVEDEIGHDDKCYSGDSHKKFNRYYPYPQSAKQYRSEWAQSAINNLKSVKNQHHL